ncbi:hypothetical protein OIDMADRAFT_31747 [Oidiodendron maius Zn]|uniref:Uncharacterized protein n=1 Tax=Oidiodendron maius (strain Zn) TaxID=913774 RepID=A0A0C3H5T7_OIDMZ|nr:hypothetical protein OIDMADRAFT_31747 [Oidiodendron maius Zn]
MPDATLIEHLLDTPRCYFILQPSNMEFSQARAGRGQSAAQKHSQKRRRATKDPPSDKQKADRRDSYCLDQSPNGILRAVLPRQRPPSGRYSGRSFSLLLPGPMAMGALPAAHIIQPGLPPSIVMLGLRHLITPDGPERKRARPVRRANSTLGPYVSEPEGSKPLSLPNSAISTIKKKSPCRRILGLTFYLREVQEEKGIPS